MFLFINYKYYKKGGKMEKIFTSAISAVVFVFTYEKCGA